MLSKTGEARSDVVLQYHELRSKHPPPVTEPRKVQAKAKETSLNCSARNLDTGDVGTDNQSSSLHVQVLARGE